MFLLNCVLIDVFFKNSAIDCNISGLESKYNEEIYSVNELAPSSGFENSWSSKSKPPNGTFSDFPLKYDHSQEYYVYVLLRSIVFFRKVSYEINTIFLQIL